MVNGRSIVLRPIERADQSFLTELSADPVVRGNVVGWDWPRSLAEQERWFEGNSSSSTHRWIVEWDERPIGMTGLWDINWHDGNALSALKLGGPTEVRGKGLGADAIKTVMAFAFYDVGLHRLYSTIIADNTASLRAYVTKCNWKEEGVARSHVWRHGRHVDLVHIGALREDFDALPDADEYRDRVCQR